MKQMKNLKLFKKYFFSAISKIVLLQYFDAYILLAQILTYPLKKIMIILVRQIPRCKRQNTSGLPRPEGRRSGWRT